MKKAPDGWSVTILPPICAPPSAATLQGALISAIDLPVSPGRANSLANGVT